MAWLRTFHRSQIRPALAARVMPVTGCDACDGTISPAALTHRGLSSLWQKSLRAEIAGGTACATKTQAFNLPGLLPRAVSAGCRILSARSNHA